MNINPSFVLCLALVQHITAAGSNAAFEFVIDENNTISKASLATLEFVAVVSRHGSRTPLQTYPNDPYPYNNKLFWPTGPDELTFYGKKQLFQTGETLRKRYSGFLPEQFYPNDTTVKYNNYNRDFMSGACILAALYPPVGNEIWNQDLLWQPIPLYLRNYDVCKLSQGNSCPSYKTESNNLTAQMDQENNKNSNLIELFKNISDFTGFEIKNISKLYDVYDILLMQEENGFNLPLWTKDYFPEIMRKATAPVMLTEYAGSNNLIHMGAGPELKYISNILNMKANNTYESNRKFYVEAAHDCTLIALLKAMGNKDQFLQVRTSAYMVFELHYLPPIHIVQVLYYTSSSDDNPEFINMAGCPNPCSLENFTEFVDAINPSNWSEKCQREKI